MKSIIKTGIIYIICIPVYIFNKYLVHLIRKANSIMVSRGIKTGKNVILHGNGQILGKENLVIEDNVRIGNNYFLFALGGIRIGRNTQISRNVCIYSSNHNYESDLSIPYDNTYINKPVVIEESCWIGMNVNIIPGVRLGKGCIVAMGSTVTQDVEPFTIVGGSPARPIGKRKKLNLFNEEPKKEFGSVFPKD
ncbi:acetyltransferase-like isoleucine patch superfamily enzyme [Winogradskyella wandonensis]|uniref:Acetyltransferase-like isoleucine patch superfamily enzyme n=1 Tax=Winogradskyella wandonensis TaxID=1442586 RepID=A0A4R1KTD4_9FLAO|nr:acyltransferase [Winogradskyella wandonensis]TCK67810.1 acetyltransferase-like isoleucine patch superfamily enzyme [Winogradskyella wandonensis]